jgi:EspA/EspE family
MVGVVSNIDEIGLELDQRAVQVEMAGAQLVRAAAEAIWTSIAADAFRARVDHRRQQFGAVADLLRDAAQSVFRYSDEVAAEKARLRRLEHAAEHVVIRGASDVGGVVLGGIHL